MNQPLISGNMRKSCLTGIHVCVRLSSPRFACIEVCNINSLPGGEACLGHVFEYVVSKSCMKEDAFDSFKASTRLWGVDEAFVCVFGTEASGRLSPAILGR